MYRATFSQAGVSEKDEKAVSFGRLSGTFFVDETFASWRRLLGSRAALRRRFSPEVYSVSSIEGALFGLRPTFEIFGFRMWPTASIQRPPGSEMFLLIFEHLRVFNWTKRRTSGYPESSSETQARISILFGVWLKVSEGLGCSFRGARSEVGSKEPTVFDQ